MPGKAFRIRRNFCFTNPRKGVSSFLGLYCAIELGIEVVHCACWAVCVGPF